VTVDELVQLAFCKGSFVDVDGLLFAINTQFKHQSIVEEQAGALEK
jgi:hypothetical protein